MLLRRLALGLAVTAIVLALLAAGLAWWGSRLRPTISVDYSRALAELEGQLREGDPEDARPVLHSLVKELEDSLCSHVDKDGAQWKEMDFSKLGDPSFIATSVPTEELLDAMREAVRKYGQSRMPELWLELKSANTLPHVGEGEALTEMLIPELGQCRRLVKFNSARMLVATESGDWEEFVDAYEQSLVLARLCSTRAFVISQLVRYACDFYSARELRFALAGNKLELPILKKLKEVRERQNVPDRLLFATKGERLLVLDTLQRTHTDDGNGDGWLIWDRLNRVRDSAGLRWGISPENQRFFNGLALVKPTRRTTSRIVEELYSTVGESLCVPYHHPNRLAFYRWCEQADKYAERNEFIGAVLMAWFKVMRAADTWSTEQAGTQVLLLIEMYRANTGTLPADLLACGAAMIKDPFTGDSFRYKVNDGGSEYVLYSVGIDGIDNGGQEKPGSEIDAIGSNDGKGFDYVFNRQRPTRD